MGAITAEMFEEVIGKVDVDETLLVAESEKAPKAPGMKYRHYAPKAKLMIVEGDLIPVRDADHQPRGLRHRLRVLHGKCRQLHHR